MWLFFNCFMAIFSLCFPVLRPLHTSFLYLNLGVFFIFHLLGFMSIIPGLLLSILTFSSIGIRNSFANYFIVAVIQRHVSLNILQVKNLFGNLILMPFNFVFSLFSTSCFAVKNLLNSFSISEKIVVSNSLLLSWSQKLGYAIVNNNVIYFQSHFYIKNLITTILNFVVPNFSISKIAFIINVCIFSFYDWIIGTTIVNWAKNGILGVHLFLKNDFLSAFSTCSSIGFLFLNLPRILINCYVGQAYLNGFNVFLFLPIQDWWYGSSMSEIINKENFLFLAISNNIFCFHDINHFFSVRGLLPKFLTISDEITYKLLKFQDKMFDKVIHLASKFNFNFYPVEFQIFAFDVTKKHFLEEIKTINFFPFDFIKGFCLTPETTEKIFPSKYNYDKQTKNSVYILFGLGVISMLLFFVGIFV